MIEKGGNMKRIGIFLVFLILASIAGIAIAADVVPAAIEQPGTQPGEVGNLESPDKCDNCHGGYNTSVEPAFNWRGSMMANAGRDPIFWATLAIAEQDFDGSGDLCIRCHSAGGWYAGRSAPTDGSGLTAGDSDGVDCDTCHKMTNPNNQEFLGVMNDPYLANNEGIPAIGYYGSGMLSLWGGAEKLGPYSDAVARHQFAQSNFHRSKDFCGSCHDVSNPVVGDLAPNNGTQASADYEVIASGDPGSPVGDKAAFNNFPYQYGIVERTYSEFYSGALSSTLVSNYANLPADLQAGAIRDAYNAALGDYADGTPRYFTCQTCHLRATTGPGCNKRGAPIRTDLPLHDLTGGNYWMPDAIQYQDSLGLLRLGGGLTTVQVDALNAGKDRARQQLDLAASLEVTGNKLKVTNLTGHKLISGYPEGRRMWLNIKWYDKNNILMREDGAYGNLTVEIDGILTEVKTLLDPYDPNSKVYEAHYGMTQEWAATLILLGYPIDMPLSFNRYNGIVDVTLGDLASQDPGTYAETFHFVLNDTVTKDNRIPPYGFSYEEARIRNALPVPANQYGGSPGGTYDYWDEFNLNPPSGASYAQIDLLYQPTSWEYVQFLYLANDRSIPFLAEEGVNMLTTWLNTGMAEPHVMASTTWHSTIQTCTAPTPTLLTATPGNQQVVLDWSDEHTADAGVLGYKVYYDQAGKYQFVGQVGLVTTFTDSSVINGNEYCYTISTIYDSDADGLADCDSGLSNIVCAIPNNQGQAVVGVSQLQTGKLTGKGKNQTFTLTNSFTAGDTIIIQATVVDTGTNLPIPNATVEITITGPENVTLTTGPSNAEGIAEASWTTTAPDRRGQGGSLPGSYLATVTGVSALGYTWDGVLTQVDFTIQ